MMYKYSLGYYGDIKVNKHLYSQGGQAMAG